MSQATTNAAEVIAGLPDGQELSTGLGTVKVGELRAAFGAYDGVAYITTDQASARFGFAPTYWEAFARECEGAVKSRFWHIPVSACEAHMEERARETKRRDRGKGKRGGRPRASRVREAR